jgi:hypothetical protein
MLHADWPSQIASTIVPFWGGEELLHVDMFVHNKSGIAYRDGN